MHDPIGGHPTALTAGHGVYGRGKTEPVKARINARSE